MVDTCGFEAAKGYMPNEYGHQKAFFIISSPGTYCVSENMLWWLHDTEASCPSKDCKYSFILFLQFDLIQCVSQGRKLNLKIKLTKEV